MTATRWLPGRTESKRRKYGNVKVGGFDSRKEAARFAELLLLERAGKVRNIRRQVRYQLVPDFPDERGVAYEADFVYEELLLNEFCHRPGIGLTHWCEVTEDTKSEATRKNREYIIKRKLMRHVHGIRIRET